MAKSRSMSIVDVARVAGVSVATASRVINDSGYPVRDTTRQRVLEAIAELNYSPSTLARALATQRSKIVGIIVHDILDPYFAEIVRGVQDVAHEHDYLTIVCNSDRQVPTESKYLRMLRDFHADGVIFAGGGLTADGVAEIVQIVTEMRSRRKETRIIALAPQRFDAALVTIDNRQACREMTEYLIGLGHQRIAFITGPDGLTTSDFRLAGYQDAIAAAGLPVSHDLIFPGNFDLESGREAAAYFLKLSHVPTAIFAANDETAIGCVGALRQEGVRIPEDITVVGFDDLKLLQSVDPPLTTVHVPLYEMGATAMRQLLRAFRDEPIEARKVLEHRLVVRASSAPPSQGKDAIERARDSRNAVAATAAGEGGQPEQRSAVSPDDVSQAANGTGA